MKRTQYFLSLALVALGTVVACGGEGPNGIATREEALANGSPVVESPAMSDTQANLKGTSDPSTEAASDCPSGYFCLWQDADYKGRRPQWRDTGCKILGGALGFNDEASSWYNRNSHNVRLFWDTGCTGRSFSASPGERASHMGGWGDEVSSVCIGC